MKRVTTLSAKDDLRSVKVRFEYQADGSYASDEKEKDCEEILDQIFKALEVKFYGFVIKVRP